MTGIAFDPPTLPPHPTYPIEWILDIVRYVVWPPPWPPPPEWPGWLRLAPDLRGALFGLAIYQVAAQLPAGAAKDVIRREALRYVQTRVSALLEGVTGDGPRP
jgi:hypothetical protein